MIYSVMTMFLGVIVLLGWMAGVEGVTSVIPGAVTMKPLTAIAFTLAGFGTASRLDAVKHTCGMLVLLSMSLAIGTYSFGIRMFDSPEPIDTIQPGSPSLLTIVAFILIGARLLDLLRPLSRPLLAIALVAIVGHLSGWPLLYYYVPGVSTGMAIHTAVGFALLSRALRAM